MIKIRQAGSHGFLLPGYNIGLDSPGRKAAYTFISHAHSDHMPRSSSASVYATPATAKLIKARGFKGKVKALDFFETLETENANITFYPAGHILGSAMTFVETEEGNLLYTGDFRNPPSPTSDGFELPEKIDYLITEATFSLPVYRWAGYDVLFDEIQSFATDALTNGYTPVFLAYSLGKTQELMHALSPLDRTIHVPKSAYSLCQIYNEMGVDLGLYTQFDIQTIENNILITPGTGSLDALLQPIPRKRVAYVSGWAALTSRGKGMNVDKRIPLSDHIDFFELVALCERIRPQNVYITHTPNPDVICHYLNQRKINASPVETLYSYAD